MDPLVIIPARVGSKGIPYKNFRKLLGKSPLERAVACAEAAGLTNIIISTDSLEVFEQLPEDRTLYAPAPLHTDTCSMREVVMDVLGRVEGEPDQKVLLLQPTQPLRLPAHLLAALEALESADSIATVMQTEPVEKLYVDVWRPASGRGGMSVEQRQNGTPTYKCDGTVYGFRRWWFERFQEFTHRTTRPIQVAKHETCSLDDVFDWVIVEQRILGMQLAMQMQVAEATETAGPASQPSDDSAPQTPAAPVPVPEADESRAHC